MTKSESQVFDESRTDAQIERRRKLAIALRERQERVRKLRDRGPVVMPLDLTSNSGKILAQNLQRRVSEGRD